MLPDPPTPKSSTVLALGVLSLAFPIIGGIAALVLGTRALKALDQGLLEEYERPLVETGRLLGIVSIFIVASALLLWWPCLRLLRGY